MNCMKEGQKDRKKTLEGWVKGEWLRNEFSTGGEEM